MSQAGGEKWLGIASCPTPHLPNGPFQLGNDFFEVIKWEKGGEGTNRFVLCRYLFE